MKVFVWERIGKVSDREHEDGGLVVFAETLERAIELANQAGAYPKENEHPDTIRETEGNEAVFVMPDAGCC